MVSPAPALSFALFSARHFTSALSEGGLQPRPADTVVFSLFLCIWSLAPPLTWVRGFRGACRLGFSAGLGREGLPLQHPGHFRCMQFSAWPLAEAREATCQAGCASSLRPPGLGLGHLVPTAGPGGRFLRQQPSTLKGSGQGSTGSLRFGVSRCSVSYKSGCPLYSEDSYSKILYIGMLPWWLRRVRILLRCGRPGFSSCVGKIPWRRAWPPPPGLLPGESHGQRSLASCSSWGRKEPDTTERLSTAHASSPNPLGAWKDG